MPANLEQTIREYVRPLRHFTLGTIGSGAGEFGLPRLTPLDFVMREADMAVCFRSPADSRHGRDIAEYPNVSGLMVHQHEVGEAPVRKVSLIGAACLLTAVEQREAFAGLFAEQLGADADDIMDKAASGGSQFYQLFVEKWEYYGPPYRSDGQGKPRHFVLWNNEITGDMPSA